MEVPGRHSTAERERIAELFRLVPVHGRRALDAGARDGFLSKILADHFDEVVALDLTMPDIDHPRVTSVCGDISRLGFPDKSFDLVLCAEVLEHIPHSHLTSACNELMRVSAQSVLIGVPYRQDLRAGRTTCSQCCGVNPPWGHVNSFDETSIDGLFNGFRRVQTAYVGRHHARTNAISAALFMAAGNPYGSYDQLETCLRCNAVLVAPAARGLAGRALTRLAVTAQRIQHVFSAPEPKWMHMLYER